MARGSASNIAASFDCRPRPGSPWSCAVLRTSSKATSALTPFKSAIGARPIGCAILPSSILPDRSMSA